MVNVTIMDRLPIEELIQPLLAILTGRTTAVLTAPPGSGKTTRIPLALLAAPWLAGRRILLLEPRRLAARAAANYMASLLGETVGHTVGYRVRLDTRVSAMTRIEVITEGVLTRMLQSDPLLEPVGIVLFDEFHERSLQADLGLALCLQCQLLLRPDLRIVVMSATLETEPIVALLKAPPALTGQGRVFPVETCWLARPVDEKIEAVVARKTIEALATESGDLLVFLPGAAEIRRVEKLLQPGLQEGTRIAPLYGALSQAAQDAALLPSPLGQRKVVLATSIAETSLTVEGVRVVIDCGLMRAPRFSPRTGMTRLETLTVSQAAADQRRGRAGRLEAGVCYRLWTQTAQARLEVRNKPEILEADLAQLVLELAAWGAAPNELLWLDPPPLAAQAQATELLQQLGALDGTTITAHGRRLAETGLHPRLAHMIVSASRLGLGGLACDLAAILSERDVLQGSERFDADIRLRVEMLWQKQPAFRRIGIEAANWRRWFALGSTNGEELDACGLLLSFAYPDRIAQRRADGRYVLANGRGAAFGAIQPLSGEPFICVADLDDKGIESRIYLAAPITLADLRVNFGAAIQMENSIAWDRDAKAIRARRLEKLGALRLNDVPLADPDSQSCLIALLAGIQAEGLSFLPWTRSASQYRQRIQFMHQLDSTWPDVSDPILEATLENWLSPYLHGMRSADHLQRLNLVTVFESMLTWQQRRELEEYAPTHLRVPSGQNLSIDYSDSEAPSLSVRLQEMFGQTETPRVGRGKIPLTLKLLSPAQRPVQVTKDLASFWRTTYFDVKKDLMGRYPKHYWPEDPLKAMPTHRARPRGG